MAEGWETRNQICISVRQLQALWLNLQTKGLWASEWTSEMVWEFLCSAIYMYLCVMSLFSNLPIPVSLAWLIHLIYTYKLLQQKIKKSPTVLSSVAHSEQVGLSNSNYKFQFDFCLWYMTIMRNLTTLDETQELGVSLGVQITFASLGRDGGRRFKKSLECP